VHAWSAAQPLPPAHEDEQYVSPPSCEQMPPLQSLSVRHATQEAPPPPEPLLLPLVPMPLDPPSAQAPSSVVAALEQASGAAGTVSAQTRAMRGM
jgi:hypothetical protein